MKINFKIILLSIIFSTNIYATDRIKIVTSLSIIEDIILNITGDLAIVNSVIKPNSTPHTYQVTPKDLNNIQNADLIIYNGLGLEATLCKFFKEFEHIPRIRASKNISPMFISTGSHKGQPDPHAWLSISNSFIYIDNITNALVKYDIRNSKIYRQNATIYKNKISTLLKPLEKSFLSIPSNKRWFVTGEGAFNYLARDLKLHPLYLRPISSGQHACPKQIRILVDQIKLHNIDAIFSEYTSSSKEVIHIAEITSVKYSGVLYAESLTDHNGVAPTYIDLLFVTMNTILEGLKAK